MSMSTVSITGGIIGTTIGAVIGYGVGNLGTRIVLSFLKGVKDDDNEKWRHKVGMYAAVAGGIFGGLSGFVSGVFGKILFDRIKLMGNNLKDINASGPDSYIKDAMR